MGVPITTGGSAPVQPLYRPFLQQALQELIRFVSNPEELLGSCAAGDTSGAASQLLLLLLLLAALQVALLLLLLPNTAAAIAAATAPAATHQLAAGRLVRRHCQELR